MPNPPLELLALIDAYAAARADRATAVDAAAWAFLDADAAMRSARAAVLAALDIAPDDAPPLVDQTTQLADATRAAEDAWRARVDATRAGQVAR